jgi:hypothetical protein
LLEREEMREGVAVKSGAGAGARDDEGVWTSGKTSHQAP